ncbi:hypothetical protein HYS97_00595 [Candidatus Daviesbacteria bacterium]|nr:hypothetical protein [Candidatus Daviesbacteria bacterium]
MASTQEFIPVSEVKEDLIILKDGSYVLVLQTSAVNFDLLSENEQLAIIGSFAGLLNSLSFPIQIVIRSKQLDISSYVDLLVEAGKKQPNPLLRDMMERYRVFVETIIRENEVLDKQFYVVLSVSSLELGVGSDPKKRIQKAQTLLFPRRDHIIKQLSRTGLKAEQVPTEKLINLLYDIYNENPIALVDKKSEENLEQPQATAPKPQTPMVDNPPQIQPVNPPASLPQQAAYAPQTVSLQSQASGYPKAPTSGYEAEPRSFASKAPFVVEELPDEMGAAA